MSKSKIDLIGKKFGHLTVVKEIEDRQKTHIKYECVCDCGKSHNVLGHHLRKMSITNCGCIKTIGKNHHQWTGSGEISGGFWYEIKRNASGEKGGRRIKEVTITIDQAWALFLKQDRKCALTGLPLHFPEKWKGDYNASLDRIDSDKDYSIDNVQWVHKHVNIMKNKFSENYFIDMCKRIAENRRA
jgi:hypothetical protein